MTTRPRIPKGAFAYYVSLGNKRSYRLVAEKYKVSTSAVGQRAKAEKWQKKLANLESKVTKAAEKSAMQAVVELDLRRSQNRDDLYRAMHEVVTPKRMQVIIATLVRVAIQKENVNAARLLLERCLGGVRIEPAPAIDIGLPEGLNSTTDVRTAANALLKGVADGKVPPEDAQKLANVLEAARKSIETEELEARITELEAQLKNSPKN